MVYPATRQVKYKNFVVFCFFVCKFAAVGVTAFVFYLLIYLCLVLGSLLFSATTKLSGIKEITTKRTCTPEVVLGGKKFLQISATMCMLCNVFNVILFWILYNREELTNTIKIRKKRILFDVRFCLHF